MKSVAKLLAAVHFVFVGAAEEVLKLGCQPASSYIRLLFLHDETRAKVIPDYQLTLARQVVPQFLSEVSKTWDALTVRGCAKFGRQSTNSCYKTTIPFTSSGSFDYMSCVSWAPSKGPVATSAAMYYATKEAEWEVSFPNGRKVVVLFASSPSETSVTGTPFTGTLKQCVNEMLPSPQQVIAAMDEEGVHFIVVTPPEHIEAFKTRYAAARDYIAVIPMIYSPEQQLKYLFAALNKLYCDVEIPPYTTTTTAPTTATTTTTSFSGTALEDTTTTTPFVKCEGHLQVLLVQDMSYSFNTSLELLRRQMGEMIPRMNNKFGKGQYEIALSSFVDKPQGLSGYPGDYCYREDVPFSTDPQKFIQTLNTMTTLSGRDWKESQFDAIKWGILSQSLGWMKTASADGKTPVKVVVMATNSGPHVAGDLGEFATGGSNCLTVDYPSETEIETLLTTNSVVPIFVVSGDIFKLYSDIMSRLSPLGVVVRIEDSATVTIEHLAEAIDKVCKKALL